MIEAIRVALNRGAFYSAQTKTKQCFKNAVDKRL